MDQDQLENQKLAAKIIISTIDNLAQGLSQNDKVIEERKIAERVTSNLSQEFISILRQLQREALNQSAADPATQLNKINEIVNSTISSIDELIRTASNEVIRLEATQSGMHRAFAVVRETGESMLRNAAKIEELAERDDDGFSRMVGERPESLPNKRNAAAVKRDRKSKVEG